jgi:hypothetical protein
MTPVWPQDGGTDRKGRAMSPSAQSGQSTHTHGPSCGHTAVRHEGHVDYLDHGHLHHVHEGMTDEHVVAVSDTNPDRCSAQYRAGGHDDMHQHGPDCGHEAVPHGDHVDYRVAGHLHHPHGDHCDDHGPLASG